MAKPKRHKTNYPGVFFIEGTHVATGKTEKIYYMRYRKNGKQVEEKAGRQYQDNMTPAKASTLRAQKIDGLKQTNNEFREAEKAKLEAERSKWTIDKIWQEYRIQRAENSSLRTDVNRYNRYLKDRFGLMEPCELRTIQIDRLRTELSQQYAPQTVKHILSLLKRLVSFGVKKGICDMPEAKKLHFEMPKVDNTKTECMTPEQLVAYWQALDEEVDQNAASLLRLALTTGMRRGALLGLKWSDVDFEKGFIVLRGAVAKNGTTERIPMSQLAQDVLSNIQQTESPYVFPGRNGEQRKEFKRIARRVRDKAGLPPDFRPLHGLRHTYASLLASSGKVDLYTLQKLLSHNSSEMTKRYAHLTDGALKRAAAVGDSVFGGLNNL